MVIPIYKSWVSFYVLTHNEEFKCDRACKNKVYLHTKFGLIFELLLKYKHCNNDIYMPYSQINKKADSLQNMNTISTVQEKCRFLNMCNLCRYARFLQAWSQISLPCFCILIYSFVISVCSLVVIMCIYLGHYISSYVTISINL